MSRNDSGFKDELFGKAKEVEGKLTGDKLREVEGKAQQAKGKLKGKTRKAKDKLKGEAEKLQEELNEEN